MSATPILRFNFKVMVVNKLNQYLARNVLSFVLPNTATGTTIYLIICFHPTWFSVNSVGMSGLKINNTGLPVDRVGSILLLSVHIFQIDG